MAWGVGRGSLRTVTLVTTPTPVKTKEMERNPKTEDVMNKEGPQNPGTLRDSLPFLDKTNGHPASYPGRGPGLSRGTPEGTQNRVTLGPQPRVLSSPSVRLETDVPVSTTATRESPSFSGTRLSIQSMGVPWGCR